MGQTPGKSLGRAMGYAFWVGLLLVLALLFGGWEAERHNPNRELTLVTDGDSPQLLLEANHRGHYLLNGRINNTKVTFLIDTGASDVVVPQSTAEAAGLTAQGQAYARTANGVIAVSRTRIDRLTLGPFTLRDISATINPRMEGEVLLGMSALKHLELGHNAEGLTLRPAP